jgi:zinc ribbon protein
MFCPRCGQQFSADVRFCSRCGLHLNVIADVTANLGMPLGQDVSAGFRRTRPKGIRIGTIIMLIAMVLIPLFIGWSVLVDGPAPLLAPLTIFLTGLGFVLYSKAFKDDGPPPYLNQPFQLKPPNPTLLASPERHAVNSFGSRRVKTSDIAEPPSVTDHTTQFFD